MSQVFAVSSASTLWSRSWAAALGIVARLVLGGVLTYAGMLKLGRPLTSARAVQAYQLLPFDVAAYVGYALPVLEILLGALLLLGWWTRGAALLGGLLMIVFIGGIASAWARGLAIDCGCFGGGGAVAPGQTRYAAEMARDAGFALCALWLVVRPLTPVSVDEWRARRGRGGRRTPIRRSYLQVEEKQ